MPFLEGSLYYNLTDMLLKYLNGSMASDAQR